MLNVEEIRLKYKPAKVKILFIGESPPANGDFFYFGIKNGTLFQHTRIAFSEVFKQECGDGKEFLRFFMDHGCYLDDLCLIPINNKPIKERKKLRQDNILYLSERIKEIKPESVIVIMEAIKDDVEQALKLSDLNNSNMHVYISKFPAWNQKNKNYFIKVVKEVITSHLNID